MKTFLLLFSLAATLTSHARVITIPAYFTRLPQGSYAGTSSNITLGANEVLTVLTYPINGGRLHIVFDGMDMYYDATQHMVAPMTLKGPALVQWTAWTWGTFNGTEP